MSGQRGLDGDLGRLEIADLAHQNDVRVLPQECPKRGRKGQADVLANLDLIDARQVELDGILGRHDVGFRRVQPRNRRVERIGLAAAGWPGHQHHPPRALDRGLEARERLGLESQPGHVEHQLVAIEQPHDDLLPEQRREHGHAEVDVF